MFDFDFFFHIYFLPVLVVELVLQETQFLTGDYFESESVFDLPLTFQGNDALVDVGCHIRVDMKREILNPSVIGHRTDFAFQNICEQKA